MKSQKAVPYMIFGGIDWWYHNRAHIDPQLARQFAKCGKTLYINSIIMTKFTTGEKGAFFKKAVRKLKSIFAGLKKTEEGFWVYSPFSLPVHHIRWAKYLNDVILYMQIKVVSWRLGIKNPVVLVANPAAVDVAIKLQKRALVYQRTDRFEEADGVDVNVIKRCDHLLKSKADLTIFVNTKLYEDESGQCRKPLFLDHGVDYELFASAKEVKNTPSDIADIPLPIVGYFGAIYDHSFDIALVEEVAKILPEMSFVFIGTVHEEYDSLFDLKNVWKLGQKDYYQIPDYGKCFDVAILPWANNRWTEASNPIKIKEYLALGKPLVCTPYFSEAQRYLEVIYLAENSKEFAERIKQALLEDCSEKVTARRDKVKQASWESKAQMILSELFSEDVNLKGIGISD